jgi:hypothetical protein
MTKDELTETINKSIKELSFARIARPALLEVFSKGEPAAFDIYDELKAFAAANNFEMRNDMDENFVVFSSIGEGKADAAQ